MEIEQFERILTIQIEKSMDTLVVKSKEYATDGDRLANFKVAAALQGVTVRQALAGMMAKHTCSVYEMCGSDKTFTDAQWDEKITDHINYLLLLKAVTVEENAPEYKVKSVTIEEHQPNPTSYAYRNSEDCAKAGVHLTEVDNDGYCTYCGWQYSVDLTAKKPEDTATVSYNQYAEAADNRSKVKRLETALKSNLNTVQLVNEVTDIIFP